ncbi:ATP-binding protein [Novipirellula sp. SH528]|uniref:ATP-binding protein n=1 Tax=Novipirellula sp. SH528 TaxID=3454466 RepID=UPI003F9F8F47
MSAESPYQIQIANPLSEPWRISRFTEPAIRGTSCIAEDNQHNMWFGLKSGVAKYDGFHWQYYADQHGLPAAPVDSLTVRSNGTLIVATRSGVYQSRPDEKTGDVGEKWQRFFPTNDQACPKFGNVVETADEVLWVCSDWGLIKFQDGESTLFTSSEYAAIIEDFDFVDEIKLFPDAFLATDFTNEGSGLSLIGRTVGFLDDEGPTKAAGIQIGDVILSVNGTSSDVDHHLQRSPGELIRASVLRYGSKKTETIDFTTTSSKCRFRSPAIHSVLRARDGKLWCGASLGRVLMSEDDGERWKTWSKPDFVVGKRPTVYETNDGKIWVISSERNGGFDCYDGENWSSGELSNLTGYRNVSPVAQTDDGTVWVGARHRMHLYRNSTWMTYDTRDKELPSDGQRMFVASDGALWILGYREDPIRIAMSRSEYWSIKDLEYQCTDKRGARWFIDSDQDLTVRQDANGTVAIDAQDGLVAVPKGIVSTEDGVVVFGEHNQSAALTTFDGTSWNRIEFPNVARSFSSKGFTVSRDGRVWISVKPRRELKQTRGIVVGRGTTWEHLQPPDAPSYATAINQLADGRMMFSGGYGAVLLDGDNWQHPTDSLLDKTICSDASVDANGTAWIATVGRGVLEFDGTRCTQYAGQQGLPAGEVAKIGIGVRGGIWANSSEGLYRFDGDRFYSANLPKSLGRQSIRFEPDGSVWFDGNKRIRFDRQRPTAVVDPEPISFVQHGESTVTWQGADAWNRTPANQLMWSYRIDNLAWSKFGSEKRVVLQDLSSGEHSLQVRSRDNDFNVSAASSPVAVRVIPPVWMRIWFITTVLLFSATLVWLCAGLIRRGVALRRSNDELEKAQGLLAGQFAVKTAQFRAICDCSPTGIFVSGTDGKLSYVNRQLARTLGVSEDVAIGDGWAIAIHPEDRDRIVKSWMQSISTHDKYHEAGRFLHHNGDVVWFEVAADAIENDNGELLGYVGAVENVTQRVHAEDDLRASNDKLRLTLDQLQFTQDQAIKRERLAALGQMAAGVAHDINNSLTPIMTFAELLAQDSNVVGKQHEWAEFIRTGVSDMSVTVRRLDHFYRASHNLNLLETVSLTELINQTVEMTKPRWKRNVTEGGKTVRVTVHSSSSPFVHAVPSQIRAVITNLIFNAADAIVSNGTVTIRIFARSENAIVEVEDDGIGMTEEGLDRCLEPFYTSKPKGSGLGLSECHGIINQHGGTLEVDSMLDKGTTVRIFLPLSRQPSQNQLPQSLTDGENAQADDDVLEKSSVDDASPCILYIDDEPMIRTSAKAMLNSIGVSTRTAADGPTGLEMLDEHEFQLVMCDRGMPGMDGIEVLQEIKRRYPELPVVIISGWSQPILNGVDADDYLEKPVAYKDLLAIVKKYLSVATIQS